MSNTILELAQILQERQLLLSQLPQEEGTVTHITYDSREVSEGTLFFCKGENFKSDYLKQAEANGAIAYVAEQPFDVTIPGLIVSDVRQAMPLVANYFYHEPWRAIHINALTGTKGKTTTTHFLKAILDKHQMKHQQGETAYFSSTTTYDGVNRGPSQLTTPESIPLFQQLANVRDSRIPFLTMEVSSQALKYRRVDEVMFEMVGFLNISTDHIGTNEHPDFADYLQSKLRIFQHGQYAVINCNTDYFDDVLAAAQASETIYDIITFSREAADADYWVDQIISTPKGQEFVVHEGSSAHSLMLDMPGEFNIDNALMAIAMARHYKVSWETIAEALAEVKAPGRMEVFVSDDDEVKAIVDYAHNKLSMEQLILSARKLFPMAKVWVVTGSAGGKGVSRRKDMGEVIGRLADKSYLTADDNNFESAYDIAKEIETAILTENPTADILMMTDDRQQAIKQALNDALEEPSDVVVLLAGKGTDDYFLINGEKIPYQSDSDFMKDYLKRYNQSK